MKELSAAEITKEALLILRSIGHTVWRQQNGSFGNRRNIATPGIPDIIGYNRNGLFVGCEVKKIGDKFSKDQLDFLRALNKGGGGAYYAVQEGSKVVIKNFEGDQTSIKKETKSRQDLF